MSNFYGNEIKRHKPKKDIKMGTIPSRGVMSLPR